MELDELCGNLDNALHYLLAVPPHRVTLHLETEHPQITLAAFTSMSVTSLPGTPSALTIALKSAVEGKIIFSNKSFAQVAPAICCFLKSFMLFLTVWMNPLIADVQTTRGHLEEQVRETKLLMIDDKSPLNFAIICDPVDFDQVL
jgi:hypothetical protein